MFILPNKVSDKKYLSETPLSMDQQITPLDISTYQLHATVKDTLQLRCGCIVLPLTLRFLNRSRWRRVCSGKARLTFIVSIVKAV
jgi:hypothetical protein